MHIKSYTWYKHTGHTCTHVCIHMYVLTQIYIHVFRHTYTGHIFTLTWLFFEPCTLYLPVFSYSLLIPISVGSPMGVWFRCYLFQEASTDSLAMMLPHFLNSEGVLEGGGLLLIGYLLENSIFHTHLKINFCNNLRGTLLLFYRYVKWLQAARIISVFLS